MNYRTITITLAALLAWAVTPVFSASLEPTASPVLGKPLVTIFADRRGAGWTSLSTADVKLACEAPVHSGDRSVSVDISGGKALEFSSDPFDSSRYGALTFWINGGETGGQSSLIVRGTEDGKPKGEAVIPPLVANTWTQVIVPLSSLGLADSARMTGLRIESKNGTDAPTFYVDDIQLTASTRTLGRIPLPFKRVGKPLDFTGVNISGGEFAHMKPGMPSVYGTMFTYPTAAEFDYFAARGVNIVRFPFHWGVLQPALDQPMIQTELDRLKATVDLGTSKGLIMLIDPHEFGRYFGKTIGSPEVPNSAFAKLWSTLATMFKDNPKVYFGLMNEPNGVPVSQWFDSAQAAVTAIRATGAKNVILVPGIDYTGAHGWVGNGSTAMANIKDPANNYMFEVHQYFDEDNSGTHADAISPTIGSERLKSFTEWCRTTGKRAILGEFGVGEGKVNKAAVDNMLTYMEANPDVWAGYTWWSAGAWWGDYMYTVEPTKAGDDRAQMWYLLPHMHGISQG
ncbi:MAG TPA: glycoside hydrolase family 5 protein [Capsulimonadaceae bacterium]|jgi:endoglucanase